MVFIRRKLRRGRSEYYAEHSFRLPDGSVKKISRYAGTKKPGKANEVLQRFKTSLERAEEEGNIAYALKHYRAGPILDEGQLREIETIKLKYKKIIKRLTDAQWKDLLDRFTVNFTYESNALEGNSLTLKDVAIIIQENVSIRGKDLREIYETMNTRKAVDLMFENRVRINEKGIIKLHGLLVKNTGVKVGYKTLPNFLLMRSVQTTPREKVPEEMGELLSLEGTGNGAHPLQKAAAFHGTFEKIHPFEDGNGRVGRMILNAMLLQQGYPPLIIRKSQRIAYFNSLGAFDAGHQDKLLRFIIERYKSTFKQFFEVYVRYLR